LSNKKFLLDSNFDPLEQLVLLKKKCNNLSSILYRVNALYLEELRNKLPQVIRTSIFSLITDRFGEGFGFSTVTSRKTFQLRIDKLVSYNTSLITIEHLSELAKKIDEENIRNLNTAKDEIANAINVKNNLEKSDAYNEINSINISSIPPLENLSITEGWNGDLNAPYSFEEKETYLKSKISEKDRVITNTNGEDQPLKDDDKSNETRDLKINDIEILQSIFGLTEEVNTNNKNSKKEYSSNESSSSNDLKKNRLLPQSPIGLYEWMLSIDTALIRRLRDLSHSINTELLKSGLINTLVPIGILDAALAGQLISSKSVSNILTLKLPTNNSLGTGGLDIDCLLVTPWDMEFDNPRLRKNRTQIKNYQNKLLGMIKQQKYWQGRSLAEEVNNEWWKDTTKI